MIEDKFLFGLLLGAATNIVFMCILTPFAYWRPLKQMVLLTLVGLVGSISVSTAILWAMGILK